MFVVAIPTAVLQGFPGLSKLCSFAHLGRSIFVYNRFFIASLAQRKQICSFEPGETETRAMVLVGVDPALLSAITNKNS